MRFERLADYPNYSIYEDGRIEKKPCKSRANRGYLQPYILKNGYPTVRLLHKDGRYKTVYVHRIVYEAFNGQIPNGYEIDHINADRADCSLANLRMCKHIDNCSNPITLARYKEANHLSSGKYSYERLMVAKSKEYEERLYRIYCETIQRDGKCGIWRLMKEGHCGYPRAKRIVEQMSMAA